VLCQNQLGNLGLQFRAMGKGAKKESETRTDFFWDAKPEPHAVRKSQVDSMKTSCEAKI